MTLSAGGEQEVLAEVEPAPTVAKGKARANAEEGTALPTCVSFALSSERFLVTHRGLPNVRCQIGMRC